MHPQYTSLLGLLGLVLFCAASLNAQPAEPVSARFVDISPTSLILIKDTFYYIETSAAKNWFNALAACRKIGYELVSLQTEEKYNQLADFLISSGQPAYFWTSGNDLYTLGSHHWYPGNEEVLKSLWAAKQPDNAGGVEHCDALSKQSNKYSLRDYNCNLAKNYICEVPVPGASTDSTTSASTSTSASDSSSTSASDSSSTSASDSSSTSTSDSSSTSTSSPTSTTKK